MHWGFLTAPEFFEGDLFSSCSHLNCRQLFGASNALLGQLDGAFSRFPLHLLLLSNQSFYSVLHYFLELLFLLGGCVTELRVLRIRNRLVVKAVGQYLKL